MRSGTREAEGEKRLAIPITVRYVYVGLFVVKIISIFFRCLDPLILEIILDIFCKLEFLKINFYETI